MNSYALIDFRDFHPRPRPKEAGSDDLPAGPMRGDVLLEDRRRAWVCAEANDILDDIERAIEQNPQRAHEAALRLVTLLAVETAVRDGLHHEWRCDYANADELSPGYRQPRPGAGQLVGRYGARVLGLALWVMKRAEFRPVQQSRDRRRSPTDGPQHMEDELIPGAWIVELMIAGLTLLLIAMAIGFPFTVYSVAISLAVGGVVVKVLHALRK